VTRHADGGSTAQAQSDPALLSAQATAPRLKLSDNGETYEAVKRMTLFDKIADQMGPAR